MTRARRNAEIIIENATAYPFRLPESAAACVYCCDTFDDPEMFRKHMEDEHRNYKVHLAFSHLHEGYVKADCTDLRCRLCLEPFEKLEHAAEHLKDIHNLALDLDFELGIQPFKIEKDKLCCAICDGKFSSLRSLSRHTQKHFLKFTCDSCGKSYSTSTSLKHHITYSKCSFGGDSRMCRKCKKVFGSLSDLREHLMKTKKCCQHVCNICGERFATWILKQNHLVDAHETPKKMYPCPECEHIFDKADAYRAHFKIAHTDDHFKCSCCGRKFDTEYRLKRHMVSHTGEKLFMCNVCSKSFPRKSTLEQHMWIHRAVKKWKCVTCDKQFNQRVSWKTHMRAHHPELCDF